MSDSQPLLSSSPPGVLLLSLHTNTDDADLSHSATSSSQPTPYQPGNTPTAAEGEGEGGEEQVAPLSATGGATTTAAAAAATAEEEERDLVEEMRFYVAQVRLLIIPIFFTFVLTIWWARSIFLKINLQQNSA